MRDFEFLAPSQSRIVRPLCPQCGTRMWLSRIEPDKTDHDKRTFECPECDGVESIVVKYK